VTAAGPAGQPKRAGSLARLLLVLVSLLAAGRIEAAPRTAGVVTAEADATRAAADVLRDGGNAVDAAVAAALALAVVHPEAGNLGGGGFAVVRRGDEVATLDFREVAPAAATPTLYLDAAGEPIPKATLLGGLAAGVPGSPAGYFELHRRFGRLPWRRLVEPAIALARDGFRISWKSAESLAAYRDSIARFPESAAVWQPGGVPLGAGELLRLPTLASTLAGYAERGPEAITTGPVARAIEETARRHGGILTAADLAAYRPSWRQPLRFERSGWSFAGMDLPSSGSFLVAEALGLLERRGALSLPRASADRAQLVIESLRRAFADRFDLGDPASSRHRLAELLAPARLDALSALLPLERATPSSEVAPGVALGEPTETTNISVIDGDGDAVALTSTINDLFGCAVWVPGAGFFLNDEMDDFATAPGRPNNYGLVQGEANRVRPGHRPLSSMTPLLLWKEGATVAVGGRGGSRIPTGVLQVVLDLWDGDSPAAAVARPRLHHQWLPDVVELEKGALPGTVRAELERRGQSFVAAVKQARINAVRRAADGSFEAGGDPRGFEAAAIVELPSAAGERRR